MARSSTDYPSFAGPAPAWLVYLILLITSGVLIWQLWPKGAREVGTDPSAMPRPIAPAGDKSSDEQNRIAIFSRVKVSVVNVSTAQVRRNGLTMSVQQVPKGTGTGFIWDEKGRVVTNYHVVENSNQVRVTLDDHTTWSVYQVRYDETHDLAVLWTDIPQEKRKPIPVGESTKLEVGQSVLAIGNPFGLDHSLSSGIISALGRNMRSEDGHVNQGLIQTDAAINPGNSGGPLLDSSGRLIGVNTAIISPSGGSSGIGFAIPVDIVNRVVPQLIRGTRESQPGLGIVEAPDQWSKVRGMDGVLIRDVFKDSSAAKAGLRPTRIDEDGNIIWGDIIVAIDNHPVKSITALRTLLAEKYAVGTEVTVQFIRDGEKKSVKSTLTASTQ